VNCATRPNVYSFRGCDTPELGERLTRERFDACVVCGWHLLSYWQAAWFARRAGMAALVRGDSQLGSPRGLALRAAKRAVYPAALRAFHGFLSPGQRHREYLRHYGVPDARIHPVPHFVDTERFRRGAAAADRTAMRKSFGAADGDRVVLFVGRLVAFKRPLDAVEAVGRLGAGGARVVLVFAGAGPLAGAVETRARELGVRVAMLGFRNQAELPGIYAAADVLVLPSDARETWGLVVNEAMACGVPAVVSDAAGCAPDLIDQGVTGFRVPCGDVGALALALSGAFSLTHAPGLASALAAKSDAHSVARAAAGTIEGIRRALARTG
jgi:glycosyltransferase involved in cell wall biosynthesis